MNHYVQKTIRLPAEKAELVNKIREEKGISWNAIVEMAVDKLLETVTAPAETPKVNNTEPKIALLSEKKGPEQPDKQPDKEDTTMDLSQFKFDMGEESDGQI